MSMSPEPLPPCGEDDPEAYAGEPVPDPWDEVSGVASVGVVPARLVPRYGRELLDRLNEGGGRGGELDSGAVPDQPA